MNSLNPSWLVAASGNSAALGRPERSRWQQALGVLRMPVWQAILATLCVLGLLLLFHQVVLGAVQNSALRHQAAAAHASGVWRCNALRILSQRENCLVLLRSTPVVGTTPEADRRTAPVSVAHVSR